MGSEPDRDVSDSVSARLELLETLARDNDRLTNGIDALAVNVATLNSLLNRVDEQQAALLVVSRDVEKIRTTSASKEELQASKEELVTSTAEYRRRLARRIYAVSGIVALFLAICIAGGIAYTRETASDARRVCTDRNAQFQVIRQFIETQRDIEEKNPNSTPEVKQRRLASYDAVLRTFPIVDCESAS